ncbi:MAG: tyrosine-type recombinase/integrase [Streptosporangiaceae bacterium]
MTRPAVALVAPLPALPDAQGLPGRLAAVLRPPFTAEVIVPGITDTVLAGRRCTVTGCGRRLQGRGLCGSHYSRWHKAGRPDLAEFTAATGPVVRAWRGLRAADGYDLRALPASLRSEVAYALQCRSDERAAGLRPCQVSLAVRRLTGAGVGSLLDRPPAELMAVVRPAASRDHDAAAFVRYAREHVEDFARGTTAEDEYQRDTWDARRLRLPANASSYLIRFGGIPQPWLRDGVKRWARFRLATGKAIGTVAGDTLALTWFARYLAGAAPAGGTEAAISRGVLEGYLSHLAGAGLTVQTRLGYLVALRGFLEASRRHGWLPRLPAGAVLYAEDMPRRDAYLPRFIPEHVMVQLESETSLARITDATTRHLIIVLIETGLRSSDACRLGLACLAEDSAGWPCLRFYNSKVRTEQMVPLSARAAAAIRAQQQHVQAACPPGTRWLFPRATANPAGKACFSYSTLHARLARWQDDIGLRDESGQPVRISAHRFRHTLGTRMINSGVPEHVVQRMLGHKSPQMTARYASLHDTTLRAAFDRYCEQRVDITGQLIGYDPGSPAADAEWVKHNLSRIRDSLPNGYCGRPPQQDCPHPNACLTCPDFQTTPEFLDVHRAQRQRTAVLIATAEQLGQTRLAAGHRKVAASLDAIIPALEALDRSTPDAS